MVTSGGDSRLELIKKSLDCYCRQTYPNKELVIVGDDLSPKKQAQLLNLIKRFKRKNIRCLFPKGKLTLGALRNISMDNAKGEIICQWDDDDLHHPERIKVQLECLLQAGKGAIYLQKFLQFYVSTRELFLIDSGKDPLTCHYCTFLFFRDRGIRFPEEGPLARRGEDHAFFQPYGKKNDVRVIVDVPYLYVYVYHGANTGSYGLHRSHSTTHAVSRDEMIQKRKSIRRWIKSFDFGHGPIRVMSKDGPVFMLDEDWNAPEQVSKIG